MLGTDLRQCFAQLRKKVVYIMQNLPQYGFSIEENLYFDQKLMKEHILEILDIDEIARKAPKGYQTMLGEENDDQYNISGGERAKLGIARNCQKEKPLLYIFDEPTAALDPIAESKIFESFDQITQNTTSIFISHRLGMVKLADKIIVMEHGEIKEFGTHESLIREKGTYYQMYLKQLKLYQRGKQSENTVSESKNRRYKR